MSALSFKNARSGALQAAAALACLWLAGCSVLPRPPAQPVRYDFGPVMPVAAGAAASGAIATPQVPRPAIALAEIEAPGLRDSETSVLYRLAYAESQVVRPYQLARWTLPPAQLVQQRLSSGLGRERAVLLGGDGTAQPKVQGQTPAVLKVELEEFSHVFRTAQDSIGWVRLRATLVDRQKQGDVLLGQSTFVAQQPAASPDAASGVRALTEATDRVIADMEQWLQQLGH